MDKSETDVLVIGAGPAGLLSAIEAGRQGVRVLVLEEHDQIGLPNHCAGILSVEGLKRLGVEPSESFIQNEIKGGKIYSPDGTEVQIRGKRTHAYIVDRARFDRSLGKEAEQAGVEILTQRRAEKLLSQGRSVTGARGEDWRIEAKVTIDAEGALGSLARSIERVPRKRNVILGINCEIKEDVEPGLVEVWLGSEVAAGFFAWVVPLEKGSRCGLGCAAGDPLLRLLRFLRQRFGFEKRVFTRRGFILVEGPSSRTCVDGLMVVGDAAGQTKGTTGGGVILGGLCGMKAGEVAAQAVLSGDFTTKTLGRYEAWWKKELGKEFSSMSSLRRIFERLSDEKLNEIARICTSKDIRQLIEHYVEEGDMDFQGNTVKRALSDPAVLSVGVRVLGRMAVAMLKEF